MTIMRFRCIPTPPCAPQLSPYVRARRRHRRCVCSSSSPGMLDCVNHHLLLPSALIHVSAPQIGAWVRRIFGSICARCLSTTCGAVAALRGRAGLHAVVGVAMALELALGECLVLCVRPCAFVSQCCCVYSCFLVCAGACMTVWPESHTQPCSVPASALACR